MANTPSLRRFDKRSLHERIEKALFRIYKQLYHNLSRQSPRAHIFIAGMQRSGTNMLMDTLERSLLTDVYHETDKRAFENYQMKDIHTIRNLAQASKANFFIIKALCESDSINLFLDKFKPAKAIWIIRNYYDVAYSAIRSFSNFTPQLIRLASGKNRKEDWRARGMSDETRDLIGTVADQEMGELNAAAMMWYYRNVLFFEQGLDSDSRVGLVYYEDLIKDPVPRFQSIFDFLEIPYYTPSITKHIHKDSLRKNKRSTPLSPQVQSICNDLQFRFDSVPRL